MKFLLNNKSEYIILLYIGKVDNSIINRRNKY